MGQSLPSVNASTTPDRTDGVSLADAIDALLPQTQCAKCGYAGCRPYAQAIVEGTADIDQCPPGGAVGISKLAQLLNRSEKPLNPRYGSEQPRAAALVEEAACIGCTLCIQACPTDAIIGAAKRMHTVVTEWCSGCGLCLPPCPVDCIVLLPVDQLARQGDDGAHQLLQLDSAPLAQHWRRLYGERNNRRALEQKRREGRLGQKAENKLQSLTVEDAAPEMTRKRAAIEAAIARARARRASKPSSA